MRTRPLPFSLQALEGRRVISSFLRTKTRLHSQQLSLQPAVGAPCVTFRRVLYGALDSHPFFPSHVASGRCVLSAAAAGAPAGDVSAFAEPSGWCAGAVLDAAGCAVCASAAPNNWRIGGCAGCCRGRLTVFAVHTPPPSGCPQLAPLCCHVHDAQVPSVWCPGGPRVVPTVHRVSLFPSRPPPPPLRAPPSRPPLPPRMDPPKPPHALRKLPLCTRGFCDTFCGGFWYPLRRGGGGGVWYILQLFGGFSGTKREIFWHSPETNAPLCKLGVWVRGTTPMHAPRVRWVQYSLQKSIVGLRCAKVSGKSKSTQTIEGAPKKATTLQVQQHPELWSTSSFKEHVASRGMWAL